MKIKFTLLVIIALAVGFGANYFTDQDEVVADYSSRQSQGVLTSYEGALMINKMLKANIETGEIEPKDYLEMRAAVKDHNRLTAGDRVADLGWKELGPDNVGGRTRAIAIVDNNTLFAGSVSGGLFRSNNGGNSWFKVPSPEFCSIGSMAITGNGDLYVGTGSQFDQSLGNGGSGFTGNGLWRSTDLGETWAIVDGTEPTFLSNAGDWNSINTLEADPINPSKVWLGGDAGVGHYDSDSDDLKMNTQAASGLTTASGQDIEISADGSVYLIVQGAGKVYASHDQGASFELKSGSDGLPNGMGRARVAISDSDPNYCYALFSSSGGAMGGAWYSDDGGVNWTPKWPGNVTELDPMGSNTQGYYDLALGVDPSNPTRALVGGVTLWHYGVTVTPAQIAFNGGGFGIGDLYVHSDIHEFETAPNGRIYIGTDGGVFVSNDNAHTFYAANRGYNCTQFYGIGISSGDPVAGGTQDNSTIVIPRDGSLTTLEEGFTIIGGDGFYTELSQATGGINMVIGTSQNGRFERYDENGAGGVFYDLNMQNHALNGDLEAGGFYTTIALFEDTEDEHSQKYNIVANPTSHDITDTTLTVFTNNLNIPYDYTLEPGDVLQFWEEIERPALVTNEPLTEDPNYWWLDIQVLDTIITTCMIDSSITGMETIQTDSIPIIACDTIYSEVLMQDFIVCDTTGYDPVFEDVNTYEYFESCETEYFYDADVVSNVREQRRIIDTYTSMFVIGFTGEDGIWLTRDALDFSGTPHWYRIVDNAPTNATKRFEFTQEGNDLFYSGWGPTLYRVSDLDSLWEGSFDNNGNESYVGGDVDSLVHSIPYSNAGGVITGIGSDPNDPDHLVISIGGYGSVSNGKIQETFNALDDSPSWSNIWFGPSNQLSKMPIYDVLVDVTDPSGQTIYAATEFGVYTTDNGGGDWTQQNDPGAGEWTTGLDGCPVFELRQQKILEPKKFRSPTNSGVIYAGTHGRGIFSADDNAIVGVDDLDPFLDSDKNNQDLLTIYPNPVMTNATLEFNLGERTDAVIKIYNIHGALIETIAKSNLPMGVQQVTMDFSKYTNGTYMIHLEAGTSSKVGRFVKL